MKPRILIVEDNTDNRRVLIHRLGKIGDFEFLEATNGREALEMIEADPPDCIFMDLKMPVLDGWEATRRIRATEVNEHVPIIAVTAQAMALDEERALAAGCDGYIAKPITHTNQITDKIASFLVS